MAIHVELAAGIAAGKTPDRSESGANYHGRETHVYGNLGPADDVAKYVPSKQVGSQRMSQIGALHLGHKVHIDGIVGGQERAEGAEEEHLQHNAGPNRA